MRTEDEVRDDAKIILGLNQTEPNIQQGTGQITTFNRLGFKGVNDKPDGWYFPKGKNESCDCARNQVRSRRFASE